MDTEQLRHPLEEEASKSVLRCQGCGAPLGADTKTKAKERATEHGWAEIKTGTGDETVWYCTPCKPQPDVEHLGPFGRRLAGLRG
jgi:hypothetical protein